jgi:hypothetical protein
MLLIWLAILYGCETWSRALTARQAEGVGEEGVEGDMWGVRAG